MEHLTNVDIYLRFFVAFGLIILLIGMAAWLARFLGFSTPLSLRGQKQRRLSVVDAIALDAKRRLILISRDDVEHLICIGGTTDFMVEHNVKTVIPAINQDLISQINDQSPDKKARDEA
jgi:flagellar protein FliO/FliZ